MKESGGKGKKTDTEAEYGWVNNCKPVATVMQKVNVLKSSGINERKCVRVPFALKLKLGKYLLQFDCFERLKFQFCQSLMKIFWRFTNIEKQGSMDVAYCPITATNNTPHIQSYARTLPHPPDSIHHSLFLYQSKLESIGSVRGVP